MRVAARQDQRPRWARASGMVVSQWVTCACRVCHVVEKRDQTPWITMFGTGYGRLSFRFSPGPTNQPMNHSQQSYLAKPVKIQVKDISRLACDASLSQRECHGLLYLW